MILTQECDGIGDEGRIGGESIRDGESRTKAYTEALTRCVRRVVQDLSIPLERNIIRPVDRLRDGLRHPKTYRDSAKE